VINTGGVTINGSAGIDVVDVAGTVAGQPLPTREDDTINGSAATTGCSVSTAATPSMAASATTS
jgi:hypothetical protein